MLIQVMLYWICMLVHLMQQNNQKNNHQNKYHTKKSFDSLRKKTGNKLKIFDNGIISTFVLMSNN